jgi:hypothetical protein
VPPGDDDEPGKLCLLEQLGADGVVTDGLDAVSVGEAVAAARPDAIVLTPGTRAGAFLSRQATAVRVLGENCSTA